MERSDPGNNEAYPEEPGDALLKRGNELFHGSPQDQVEAARVYRQGAALGNAACQYMLARCYHTGRGVVRSTDECDRLLRLSAAQLDLDAMYTLATRLAHRSQHAEAFALWMEAARHGDAASLHKVGVCYSTGRGVAVDSAAAWGYWCAAAAQGHAGAITSMAHCHRAGVHGIQANEEEALRLFRKAADMGGVEAQKEMGDAHFKGTCGLPQDIAAALMWYRSAALGGNVNAQLAIANYYEEAIGGARDPAAAASFYGMAVKQGDAEAAYCLALMLEAGDGVPCDEDESVRLFRVAAVRNHRGAQWELAQAYEEGRGGLRVNMDAAMYWYRRAAREDCDARLRLGQLLEGREGVEPNVLEAARWYCAAAEDSSLEEPTEAIRRLLRSGDLRIAFVIGNAPLELPHELETMVKGARCIRRRSSERARRAALCWVWARLLPRDVVRIVARRVYDSRCDPAVWAVALDDGPAHVDGNCALC